GSGFAGSGGGKTDSGGAPITVGTASGSGVMPVATFDTPTSVDACIDVGDACVKPQKACESGTADVILGPDGQQLSVICYPNRNYSVDVLSESPVSKPPIGNNTVVVLDDKDDGVDV